MLEHHTYNPTSPVTRPSSFGTTCRFLSNGISSSRGTERYPILRSNIPQGMSKVSSVPVFERIGLWCSPRKKKVSCRSMALIFEWFSHRMSERCEWCSSNKSHAIETWKSEMIEILALCVLEHMPIEFSFKRWFSIWSFSMVEVSDTNSRDFRGRRRVSRWYESEWYE